jgi:acetyl-CoA C-acetyltransferase
MQDDRTPILVGLGEATRRASDPELTSVPAFIAHTLRCAAADAYDATAPGWNEPVGGEPAALLAATDLIAVAPSASWPNQAPGVAIGEELGLRTPTMRSSMVGGNGSQLLVNEVAGRIQAGEIEVALVCGGEALHSQRTPFEDFGAMAMTEPDGSTEVLEADHPGNSEAEIACGLMVPVLGYALMEQAIGRSAGRTISEQRAIAAELWSSFSAVAAAHPNAWIREARSAEEIATPTADNRQVSWPYTKLMVANLRIDEAAGVVMCSVGAARRLGIPESRWVYVHAGAQANDEWFLSERTDLDRSPAIRACGEALFDRAGITGAELGPVDLYSCFPSAVEIAARELGLPVDDPSRPLTCTGGLTFFGGPGNNYGTHGVVGVARALREAPAGTLGISSSLGWYATKHAIGLYGNAAPEQPYATLRPTPAPARREVASPDEAAAVDGATVEVATAFFGRDGAPEFGIVFALLPDGRRAIGRSTDPELLALICSDDFIGRSIRLAPDRTVSLAS